jgi:hypothetical protein
VPNPSGANNMNRQYGDVQQQKTLTRAAPMSGTPVATNAPQRAQRKAVRGKTQAEPMAPAPPTQVPYATQLAMEWQQLASEIPDDPLVRYYADQAARHAGRV